ncbi:hypothetical protein CC78DRAFT_579106 [Lojkania enalia]|uniref:Uncharacterized protein n=1 Tax=Lojkania enalia TaxID=147567 RepID=A0A9P4KGC1_9PLEO|nr:hypothetical protein CC78DRAFT_579106 [Didymosphaeria enalia]
MRYNWGDYVALLHSWGPNGNQSSRRIIINAQRFQAARALDRQSPAQSCGAFPRFTGQDTTALPASERAAESLAVVLFRFAFTIDYHHAVCIVPSLTTSPPFRLLRLSRRPRSARLTVACRRILDILPCTGPIAILTQPVTPTTRSKQVSTTSRYSVTRFISSPLPFAGDAVVPSFITARLFSHHTPETPNTDKRQPLAASIP